MQTILIILSIGALIFLTKVGLIAYETLQIDFHFDKPWPEEIPQSSREVIVETHPTPHVQPAGRTWGWVATRLQLRKAA